MSAGAAAGGGASSAAAAARSAQFFLSGALGGKTAHYPAGASGSAFRAGEPFPTVSYAAKFFKPFTAGGALKFIYRHFKKPPLTVNNFSSDKD